MRAAPPRVLFLDDDPERAAAFRARHPQALWVATAAGCIGHLAEPWDEVHLDHDLGGRTHVSPEGPECGMEVVRWLGERPRPHLAGTRFVVHTRNPNAAWMMALHLEEYGFEARLRPFDLPAAGGPRPATPPAPRLAASPRPMTEAISWDWVRSAD